MMLDRERPVVEQGAGCFRLVTPEGGKPPERLLEGGGRLAVPAGHAIGLGEIHGNVQLPQGGGGPRLGQQTLRGLSALDARIHVAPLAGDLAAAQETDSPVQGELWFVREGLQALLDELLRALPFACAPDRAGQRTGGLGPHGGFGKLAGQLVRPAEHLTRLVILVPTLVLPADGDEYLHAVLVGLAAIPLDDLLRASEKIADGERLSGGSGVREQEGVQVVDRFGARELPQREVPLRARRAGFLVGPDTLLFGQRRVPRRPARLGDGAEQAGDKGHESQRGEGDGRAVSAHELGEPIGERVRPGADRPVIEVTLEIVGKSGRRSVTLGRLLLQRLGDDGVEVALQRAARLRVLDGIGESRRLHVHDRPEQLGGRAPRLPRRMLSAEKQIEQRAQGVDVRGDRDGPACHLLGRRVLGRERTRRPRA